MTCPHFFADSSAELADETPLMTSGTTQVSNVDEIQHIDFKLGEKVSPCRVSVYLGFPRL